MARSIYHIDLHTLINHRHILGEDRDSPFPFKVIVVKDKLSQLLLLALLTRLIDHPVDQSSLSMVNVSDDRDISDFLHSLLIINQLTAYCCTTGKSGRKRFAKLGIFIKYFPIFFYFCALVRKTIKF